MRRLLAALALAAFATAAAAQNAPSPEARAEIAKLGKLVGHWKGEGWVLSPHGRHDFTSEERAEMRLDGGALVIEGLHRDASGAIVHQALGVLGWDRRRKEYRFGTALSSGATGYHRGRIEDGRFIWTVDAPGPERRFVIPLEGADTWEEYGEVTSDGGRTWRRFFEMKLTRVK